MVIAELTLTHNEVLMGLEARSRELWEEQFASGLPVHVGIASTALVRGCDMTWQHRIIVEFAPTGGWRYFYRPNAFTMPTPLENRDEALAAIETFRPGVVGMTALTYTRQYAPPSTEDRFWVKVDKSGDCWLWTGHVSTTGYGQFKVNRVTVGAHRFAYESAKGPIPKGLDLDHLCRTPRCVNPGHLEAVTHHENILRGASLIAQNARVTVCPAGHAYDLLNTYIRPDGKGRDCIACRRERDRRRVRVRGAV